MRSYFEERENFIAELEALPYGEGVLVLPNRALQTEVSQNHMIACSGIDGLAMQVLNLLGGHDYEKLNRQTQELIVGNLVSEHYDELVYFQGIARKPGFVRELTSLFTELRRCDVESAESLETVFSCWQEESSALYSDVPAAPVAKNQDVVLLFGAYLDYLKQHKLTDVEGFFRLAVLRLEHAEEDGRLRGFLSKFPRLVCVSDFTKLSPLRRLFLKSLAKVGVEVRGDLDGLARLSEIERENFGRVQVPVFFGRYACGADELQGALRDIREKLAQGAAAEDFLIVAARPEDFSGVSRAAEAYGVALALPDSAPLNQYPLVEQVTEELAAADSVKGYTAQIREKLTALELPLTLGTAYRNGLLDIGTVSSALSARQGLEQVLADLEHMAELCPFVDFNLSVQGFRNLLADALRQRSLMLRAGDAQGVQFTSVVGALGLCRKYVYVLGVNEGSFPAPVEENWIYTDRERRCLHFDGGVELPVTGEQVAEDEYNFGLLLQQVRCELHLSWSMLTADSSGEQDGKSFYVERMLRFLPEEQAVIADHRDLSREAGVKPVSLQEVFEHFEQADEATRKILEQRYDLVRLTGQVLADRQRGGLSPYNGDIGAYFAKRKELRLSASALEDYAKCPFVFMAKRIWQQEAEEKAEDLPAYEAGNLLHGVIACFYAKFQQKYGTLEQPYPKLSDAGVDLDDCQRMLQEAWDEQEHIFTEKYAEAEAGLQLQIRSCQRYVNSWWGYELQEQSEVENMRPLFFERKFYSFEPVPNLTPRVVFDGAIDRIDGFVDNSGSILGYYVTDYKTGSAPVGKTNFQIPLYVTAIFGAENFGFKPACGSYLSVKEKKRKIFSPVKVTLSAVNKSFFNPKEKDQKLAEKTEKFRQETRERIGEVLDLILAGNFAAKQKREKNCDYCQFRTVCRAGGGEGNADE